MKGINNNKNDKRPKEKGRLAHEDDNENKEGSPWPFLS